MKSLSFGNFQVGMVDDPSVEDQGGFEFASGMDIFSEPGVLKACYGMTEVTYGSGATPTGIPLQMVEIASDSSTVRAYIIADSKILESTDGLAVSLFRTNSYGVNIGLEIFNDYVWYAADDKLGRAPIGNGAAGNDTYNALPDENEFHPMLKQGGTLKIGSGRYVSSVDEAGTVTQQALKLPSGYRVRCLAEHFTNLFVGTRFGKGVGGVQNADSSVFAWRGTVLSAGSALPETPFPMKLNGMNALISDGRRLLAFPDSQGDVYMFDGAGFVPLRRIYPIGIDQSLVVNHGAVSEYKGSVLFAGASSMYPGVFQMKGDVLCQSFVPALATPGEEALYNISFVKQAFNSKVFIGYYKASDSSFHIEFSDTTKRQNNALIRTLWHRAGTDKNKRWGGVKLNLKPLGSCSVAVAYRTDRNAAFSSTVGTVTASNQHRPVLFPVNPRSREIQFKFTYTTNSTNTPELLSYDPLFEILKSSR